MGGKGSAGGGQGFTLGSGGGGGGGKKNPYSGGAMNVGAWNPGGGKVPSYNKSGAQGPRGESRGSDNRTGNEKKGKEITLPSGNKLNMSSLGSRAAGTTFGAMLGGFLAGGPGAAYGGYKGYQSSKEGWIGDAFNSRTGETYRDYLEKRGVSRKDTSLAAKHGVLEQGARDQGYRGSESVSLLDEGEDYDSITGEIF